MEGLGGYFVDEKAVRVETIFLDFLKRFVLLLPRICLFVVCFVDNGMDRMNGLLIMELIG
jgi:hypothetical protein